jgi:hypothetical protein
MSETRLVQRAALSTVLLSCALAASSSAQDAQTTVVRTRGDRLNASFEAYGDCSQRSFFASAESSVSRTRVDGTRAVDEVNRLVLTLGDYDACARSTASFTVELPDLNGVTWNAPSRTAAMVFSRPVDVYRCSYSDESGSVCGTSTELLSVNIVWTGTGDFEETVFVRKETLSGTYVKERTRSQSLGLSATYSIALNGQPITFSSATGSLETQRVGTLTTGPL